MSTSATALFHRRHEGVTIPNFVIAIGLSVLLHVAVVWFMKFRPPPPPDQDPPPLTVKLQPSPGPPPFAAAHAPPVAVPRPRVAPPVPPQPAAPAVPPPSAAVRPPPPVIARESSAPTALALVEPTPPTLLRVPPAGDFASLLEARRRSRGESFSAVPSPAEDENARATRLAVANLSSQKAQPTLGEDPNRSGGIFNMRNKSVDYAEFMFYGWHGDARRNMQQLVEVRKGGNPTIELAVVRKMIEIIREHAQADFSWHSYRLNRGVTLSARQRDTAGLEKFLLDEFFYNPRSAP